MSKTKKIGKNHYEILFIIPNNFTEDEAKSIYEKTKEKLSSLKGEISYEEYWGKKKLAYEINHHHYGYYGLIEFDIEAKEIEKINRDLRLSKEILRHQIVSIKKRSIEEIKKEKEKQEKSIKKDKNIDKKETDVEEKKIDNDNKTTATEEPKKEKSTKSAEKKKAEKSDLKDLDKKLEGLLDVKDLI